MTAKASANFWWLKKSKTDSNLANSDEINAEFSQTLNEEELATSLVEILQKEKQIEQIDYGAGGDHGDVDIDSIIDEMKKIAAASPLGPFDGLSEDRSVEDLMKEAEKIYIESSRSFEQLSQHSATSHNISEELNTQSSISTPTQSPVPVHKENGETKDDGTPTPKSISPMLENEENKNDKNDHSIEEYSDDFSENKSDNVHDPSPSSKGDSNHSVASLFSPVSPPKDKFDENIQNPAVHNVVVDNESIHNVILPDANVIEHVQVDVLKEKELAILHEKQKELEIIQKQRDIEIAEKLKEIEHFRSEVLKKDNIIEHLIEENKNLKEDMKELQSQLEETISLLEQAKNALKTQSMKSPEINLELDKALEEVKDTKEINTALQLQLDTVNKSHQLLKFSYDELQTTNKHLDRKLSELDSNLAKCKSDLVVVQQQRDKLQENEVGLNKLLEIERLQVKSLKLQTEKDARCIMDLNRQIKEMERIIARKHPDSVSALIVAAKNDVTETNLSTKRFLEDRIKVLEMEAQKRDVQNSKVFIDVQEKFNQMKLKYESHIEDLELHVNDLKSQLKYRADTYDVYTQTMHEDLEFPQKDTVNVSIQTDAVQPQQKNIIQKVGVVRRLEKVVDNKEETHLLATIRGLQADLSNKEKVIVKLQREIEDLRKTNRRLQKEREGSLRNLSERREFRSYPDRLAQQLRQDTPSIEGDGKSLEDELKAVKSERDKMKSQLCRMEEDYQSLKGKRLQDLNTLQEAHEKEISTYLTNITPLREQLEIQQISLSSLQKQLSTTKEELAIVTVERDHLNNRLQYATAILPFETAINISEDNDVLALQKKISYLEKRYEEREHRLRAIVHGLAQKNLSNMTCEQCAARQQQLIGYKVELDQLIATLKSLQ